MPAEQSRTARLGKDERIAGRAFSDPAHTGRDLVTLGLLRAALRRAAIDQRARVLRFADDVGEHTVSVPDWAALESRRPIAVIGFFGQAREEVDHAAIVALEHQIVARASTFPGLLAYHNARLRSGEWGNMVLFASRADAAAVTGDAVHADAVERTPRHYASLRLHRGVAADGGLGTAGVTVAETLYLHFADHPAWRGLRVYAQCAEH
jgi:hypothetical protein